MLMLSNYWLGWGASKIKEPNERDIRWWQTELQTHLGTQKEHWPTEVLTWNCIGCRSELGLLNGFLILSNKVSAPFLPAGQSLVFWRDWEINVICVGAVSVEQLDRVIVDASALNAKQRGILDMQETEVPLSRLLSRADLQQRFGSGGTRIAVY